MEPARVFLLSRAPQARRLVAVATNAVALQLGQPLKIPETTNLVFLTLQVNRTVLGKLKGLALSPSMLVAYFQYQDGTAAYTRAILPILSAGVLVNRRVESASETRNWLETAVSRNVAVSSITFTAFNSWTFRPPFEGALVEYRLTDVERDNSVPLHTPAAGRDLARTDIKDEL